VVGGQLEVGLGSAQDAGVRELRHARRVRGFEHGAVLRHPLHGLVAGDQQDAVAGAEGPGEGLGLVVVGDAQLDAARREVCGLLLVAYDCGDLLGGDRGEQLVDDETAEGSGGSGDDDAQGGSLP
jgi:hypothetical protein